VRSHAPAHRGETQLERPEDDGEEAGGSLLSEVSVVTLIVFAVTIIAIVGYGLLLIFELFF